MSPWDRPVPGEPPFDSPARARRWRAAHRAVQDHLLAVIAASAWGEGLVLRGSLPLRAWLGPVAREPGDLDWIVLDPPSTSFVDGQDPFPYVDSFDPVQLWPEAVHGAGAPELWTCGDHHLGGTRAVVAPDGLHWMTREEADEHRAPHEELAALLAAGPPPPDGIRIDPGAVRGDGTWMYRVYETPGERVVVPWEAEGLPGGELRMDFAADETLPESPVWTACPRGDGGAPVPVRTAGPGLSLAWKLLWLTDDSGSRGHGAAKDLYDAVLLAEHPGTRLAPGLLRRVLGAHAAGFAPRTVRGWTVDWDGFGAAHPWVTDDADGLRERLEAALGRLADHPRGSSVEGSSAPPTAAR